MRLNSRLTAICGALGFSAAMNGHCLAADVELPSRKPGLWEIHMVRDEGKKDTTMRACIDAATDKAMLEGATSVMQSLCKRRDIKRDGDTYTWDSTCSIGPIESSTHTVVSGDFQSSYTMKTTGDISGMPGLGNGKSEMSQTAKWVSEDCPEGFSPGDMEMPGGMKINVNDAMKMLNGLSRQSR